MNQTSNPIAQNIVRVLMALPPSDREEGLQLECGSDPALRAEVQRLLDEAERAQCFVSAPTTASSAPPLDLEKLIGPYKLLQQIGEGGFGVVYMAEQSRPVKRRVALKVIKLGMDTREVVARFEAERQALAMMDHPNIARVFDAGATDSGRPYFVMELVNGISITRYCDAHQLTARQRLELMVPVCRAVQSAHQKGIIHRDLKPSNVMVTLHDGKPVPKVIDFGIAKATRLSLTDRTLFTAFHQVIGTPLYMSPEQAEMSGLDIDTRTDVYALGVLLYELLTGTTPVDPVALKAAPYDEMVRMIRDTEPAKPSTRLQALGATLTAIATSRRTDARKLSQTIRGELDWIVMKTLEKDRTRRYDTAAALADDLERYLNGEAVAAGPPSGMYRLKKLARRHRTLIAFSTTIMLALLIGVIGLSIGVIYALHQKRLASEKAEIAQAVTEFQLQMMEAADPDLSAGKELTVIEAIHGAIAHLDAGSLSKQPLVEAAVRNVIGQSLQSRGDFRGAVTQFEKSLALSHRVDHPDLDPDVAQEENNLAQSLALADQPESAVGHFQKSLEIYRNLRGQDHAVTLVVLANLADCLIDLKRFDEAVKPAEDAVAIAQHLPADQSVYAGRAFNTMATLRQKLKQLPDAELYFKRSLEIVRKPPVTMSALAAVLNNLAGVQFDEGKFDDAQKNYAEALTHAKQVFSGNHPFLAHIYSNNGKCLVMQKKFPEAREAFESALKLDEEPADTARDQLGLASALEGTGQFAKARDLATQARDIYQRKYGSKSIGVHNATKLLDRLPATQPDSHP